MEEQKVYLLLTDTGTIFTRLIKRCTKKPYNHASISFVAELEEVYSFGRKMPHNPFIGGFVRENLSGSLFIQANSALFSLTVSETDIVKMKHYIKSIEAEKESYRYNLIGLFGVLFNKPIKRKRAFFCSQFTANVLNQCHQITFEKDLALITPYDLTTIEGMTMEYEGKLRQYIEQNKIADNQISLQNMVQYS